MVSIVIGTAGHIDHGKSALVKALTGTDPDRLKEERERGITIDLGFAHVTHGDVTLSFVDVPGHERFVRNMLAGAGGVDLVLLVVAADESVMPQTREHFQICRLLQVPAGIVALTKTDLVDPETIELATLEVRELVEHSFLAEAPIIPVSARTGEGLDRLRDAMLASAVRLRPHDADGPARLPIDRVFSMKGFGTVVTGTLVSGTLREEQDVVLLPDGRHVKVRGLQVHGRRESRVGAGRRVAINLAGVDAGEVARGDTLCESQAFETTRSLDVALELLPVATGLRDGSRVRFHQGTSELLGRLSFGSVVEQGNTREIVGRLRLERPAVVTRGDRFIIRAYSPLDTIGGGVVLDPHPGRSPVRTAAAGRRLRALTDFNTPDSALAVFLEARGAAGLHTRDLVKRAGMSPPRARAAIARLTQAGSVTAIGEYLVASGTVNALEQALLRELAVHHAAHPLSEGIPREEARERVFRRAAPPLFDAVVGRLTAAGRIVARERLTLSGHRLSLSADEERVQSALDRIYRDAKLTPPDLASAAAAAAATLGTVERIAALMVRSRTLVKVESLFFHATALEDLKNDVRGLKAGSGAAQVDVAAFKERYGITRKYAIPLLEYLDRERVTRRAGETRIVL